MMKKHLIFYLSFVCLIILTGLTRASAEPYQTIINNGSPQNRVDIAVLGDGYTAAQLAQYQSNVQQFFQGVFAQEPYREYQRYYNVHRIDVTSIQSGADHPERVPPVFVDTALDATYNCGNISTPDLRQYDQSKSDYCRESACRTFRCHSRDGQRYRIRRLRAVRSRSLRFILRRVELILHEVGHSFGLLADEYAGGGPSCNPNIEPSEPNATRETNRALIKWNAWIDMATPIPTTTTTNGIPGLYVGSKYCDTGLYRPTYNNKMRVLGVPFEQINTEQHVKRIHAFVSPIDASAPAGTNVSMTTVQTQPFSITPTLTLYAQFEHQLDG